MQMAGLVALIGLAVSGFTSHIVIGLDPSAGVTIHASGVTLTVETDSLGIATFATDCELPPCTVQIGVTTGVPEPGANCGGCQWSERG